ncbi:YrhB domain-containing protein [Agrococcus sp. SGAir0287]|uniref:YrhB domain-containing protein n=1 Tax=Agrococcus sp. SGAir0287 TaxID=2070347 RepID=UPI0010CCCA4C|nr:YrhB domain-containing protein [Agrococcus sp. SGAir0287]QCR18486.1 hypothetical protein C1N71_02645 [Agrococcus sp. SGAir0287]
MADAGSTGRSREDALATVRLLLDALEAQSGARYAIFAGERGIDGVLDVGDAWVIVWNDAEHVATGDPRRALIDAGPYLVAKHGDDVAMLLPTLPVDDGAARWRATRRR